MGNTAMLISSSNYAKKPYECVHRRRFVFLVFSNFSETPCMKVDFDVRISPVWCMRAVSRRWEILFSFVFLDFTSTCGEQPFGACSHNPGTAHCLGATHWPRGLLCLGAWSDVCNCSREFLLVLGQLGEVAYPLYSRPCQGNFLHVNRTQKLPPGKSSLAHAHYLCLE